MDGLIQHSETINKLLAQIMDPYLGTVIEDVVSPVEGIVFFHASQPIIYSQTSLFRIIPT